MPLKREKKGIKGQNRVQRRRGSPMCKDVHCYFYKFISDPRLIDWRFSFGVWNDLSVYISLSIWGEHPVRSLFVSDL